VVKFAGREPSAVLLAAQLSSEQNRGRLATGELDHRPKLAAGAVASVGRHARVQPWKAA